MKRIWAVSTITILGVLVLGACCHNNNSKCSPSGRKQLTRDSEIIESIEANKITLDLCSHFLDEDVYDAYELIGSNYTYASALEIKFKTHATIINATKTTRLYPTIWAGPNDNVIQFVYLFDQCQEIKESILVKKNTVYYPVGCPSEIDSAIKRFSKISMDELIQSIERIPDNYKNKETLLDYGKGSWALDEKAWKKIARKYHMGDFVDGNNEPFSFAPYEIYLEITFRQGNSEYTKTFCDKVVIGN